MNIVIVFSEISPKLYSILKKEHCLSGLFVCFFLSFFFSFTLHVLFRDEY